jgi:hypothetical protein
MQLYGYLFSGGIEGIIGKPAISSGLNLNFGSYNLGSVMLAGSVERHANKHVVHRYNSQQPSTGDLNCISVVADSQRGQIENLSFDMIVSPIISYF